MGHWVRTLLVLALLPAFASCGDSASSGNNTACGEGETCHNDCGDDETSCNMACDKGATCTATCRANQSCSFACGAGASCAWDCAAGSCQVSGASTDCRCSGTCVGTCSGSGGEGEGEGSGGEGEGSGCNCGAPTDPGYAACMAACN